MTSYNEKLLKALKELADYDELHGGFIVINQAHWLRKPVGSPLGWLTNKGYLYTRLNKNVYPIHHLVWLWYNGYLPKQLDHINRNKLDNRILNLREASNTLNQLNKGAQSNNKLGVENIRQLSSGNYEVRICEKTIGTFYTIDTAIQVRDSIKNRTIKLLTRELL